MLYNLNISLHNQFLFCKKKKKKSKCTELGVQRLRCAQINTNTMVLQALFLNTGHVGLARISLAVQQPTQKTMYAES